MPVNNGSDCLAIRLTLKIPGNDDIRVQGFDLHLGELKGVRHSTRAYAADRADTARSAYYNRSDESDNFFDEAVIEEGPQERSATLHKH